MWSSKLKEFEKSTDFTEIAAAPTDAVPDEPQNVTYDSAKVPVNIFTKEILGYGVGLSSMLTEILLSHPFLVLRHQCQVRSRSKMFHLQPFSLLPIMQIYITRQGIFTLWKGLSGVLTVRAISFMTENLIAEVFPLAKQVTAYSSPRKIVMHILLKVFTWAACTPFYAASMVEFVQSDIASEPTSLISCFLEGLRRLLPGASTSGPRMGSLAGNLKANLRSMPIRTSRLLPIWRLLGPVVVFGVGQYIIRTAVCFAATSYLRQDMELEQSDADVADSIARTFSYFSSPLGVDPNGSTTSDTALLASQRQETALQITYLRYTTDLTANLWASLAADVLLYPLETIVIRLCVQGTRTLVDNLDTATSVLPIVSMFDGPLDVVRSSNGGILGLYRGFGALCLQYAVQAAFLVGIKYAYEQLLCHYSSSSQQPPSVPRADPVRGYSTEPINVAPHDYRETPQSTRVGMDMPSVWQPMMDQSKWRASDPVLVAAEATGMMSRGSSIGNVNDSRPLQFRGYDPWPFNPPS